MYRIMGSTLTFNWPEDTGIAENITDLIAGIHDAAIHSLGREECTRIVIPNYSDMGIVEARLTPRRVYPKAIPGQVISLVSSDPYGLLIGHNSSPYYALSIPGFCCLVDSAVLTINPNFAEHYAEIAAEVFNGPDCQLVNAPLSPYFMAYANMSRTLSLLMKRPRVPKIIDFMPIFTAMFGEKIATVIMKEITK